jgi:hypothetical protein
MNRKVLAAVLTLFLAFTAAPTALHAFFGFGVSASDQGLNNFYIAVGDYNNVQQRDVVSVRRQGIPDEELPVVFYLAAQAHVPYREIVQLRMQKLGWMQIAMRYKLDPSIFYVPVKGQVRGAVYGKTYGYYQGRPHRKWKQIKLSDADVVNFVNLKFVSEHYKYDPAEVIKMREGGKSFVAIHTDVREWHTKKGRDVREVKKVEEVQDVNVKHGHGHDRNYRHDKDNGQDNSNGQDSDNGQDRDNRHDRGDR